MFPLGLFSMAVLFDLADLLGAPDIIGALAYWNIVAGLIGGVLAALANAIDLMFVRNGTPAKRIGVLQGLSNMGVLILFAVILMLRMRTPDRVASGGLFAVELLALARIEEHGAPWRSIGALRERCRAQRAECLCIVRFGWQEAGNH